MHSHECCGEKNTQRKKRNMDLLGAIAIISISIVTAIYAFFKYSFQYWKSRGIPYDEPSIPYGNISGLGKVIHPSHFVKNAYDRHRSSGAKLCGVYFFARPVAILLDLELIKTILIKDFALFNERGKPKRVIVLVF